MRRDFLTLATLALALIAWLAWQTRPEPAAESRLSASGLLTDAPEAFHQVTGPRPFVFPEDHAAHPGYRNEWWYFTGNMDGADGNPWGFQFTLFRFELDHAQRPDSAWSAEAVWMAHLALSDVHGRVFHQAERFARGAMGLAGASEDRWWLRDWEVRRDGDRFSLKAGTDQFGLELEMESRRPVVQQGEMGYSQKGPRPDNASYYYSITRLNTSGSIRVENRQVPVKGLAWLDREWGSSQLTGDMVGWDWFSLQLDDGRDLMAFRLRSDDGQASRFSAGKVVYPDGSSRTLGPNDFTTTPARRWRDAEGHQWPLKWIIELPSEDLALTVEARFDDQRWRGAVSYWEGAVGVRDAATGEKLGRGYLELSGYAD